MKPEVLSIFGSQKIPTPSFMQNTFFNPFITFTRHIVIYDLNLNK